MDSSKVDIEETDLTQIRHLAHKYLVDTQLGFLYNNENTSAAWVRATIDFLNKKGINIQIDLKQRQFAEPVDEN